MKGHRIRDEVKKRLRNLITTGEMTGWTAYEGLPQVGEEYPLTFKREIRDETKMRRRPSCDGWLLHAEEGHLILLEFELGRNAPKNAAKILCYAEARNQGKFDELMHFRDQRISGGIGKPGRVTVLHFSRINNVESEYDKWLASELGRLFEMTGRGRTYRHFSQRADTEVMSSEEQYAKWVVENVRGYLDGD